jgi:metal-responsive CopG/Arc/MetJ family transcriptional regulator
MKALSLKLDDRLFFETERILERIKKPRNSFFNDAIDFYIKHKEDEYLTKQLAFEAELLAEDTLEIIAEMENLDPELID